MLRKSLAWPNFSQRAFFRETRKKSTFGPVLLLIGFFFLPTRFRRTEGGTCVSCSRLPDRGLAARAEGGPRPSYDPPPPSRLCSMREGGRLSSDGGPAIGLASDLETSPWAHVKQWRIRCAYNTHTHYTLYTCKCPLFSFEKSLAGTRYRDGQC